MMNSPVSWDIMNELQHTGHTVTKDLNIYTSVETNYWLID